jgi:hypothetical protein
MTLMDSFGLQSRCRAWLSVNLRPIAYLECQLESLSSLSATDQEDRNDSQAAPSLALEPERLADSAHGWILKKSVSSVILDIFQNDLKLIEVRVANEFASAAQRTTAAPFCIG